MKKLMKLIDYCYKSDSGILHAVTWYCYYKLLGKTIIKNNRVMIRGVRNIYTDGLLRIGISPVGFTNKHDRTFLNIRGKLSFHGDYSIGKGCRFDIGPEAFAEFNEGYVNANTNFIIMHGLCVGNGTVIGWRCQFLDEDFHHITYINPREREREENSCRQPLLDWKQCNLVEGKCNSRWVSGCCRIDCDKSI